MMFVEIAAVFLLGSIIASFVGVVVARLNTGQSIWYGHSRCDTCDARISAHMLLPIVSHIISGGKAQCCGAHISHQSFFSEITLGILFSLLYVKLGLSAAFFLMAAALSLILALVLYDLAHHILPSILLYPFAGLSVAIAAVMQANSAFFDVLTVAGLIAGSLLVLHIASRGRAMGFADVPLSFGLAMMVGDTAFSGFIFSFWIGAISGLAILARRPKGARMGIEVPFAPYLAAGFLLAYFTQWNPFIVIEALL